MSVSAALLPTPARYKRGGGGYGEADVLAACYRRILEVSDGLSARSIAVPAIATGVYGFPMRAAARIAVRTLLATPTDVETVRLVAFDGDARDVPASALELALADG